MPRNSSTYAAAAAGDTLSSCASACPVSGGLAMVKAYEESGRGDEEDEEDEED
jgi:hypothetical protein